MQLKEPLLEVLQSFPFVNIHHWPDQASCPNWNACSKAEGAKGFVPSKVNHHQRSMAVSTCAGCSTGRVLHDAPAVHAHPGPAAQRPTVPWQQCTARLRSFTREQRGKGCLRRSVADRTLRCSAGWSRQPCVAHRALRDRALLSFKACSTRLKGVSCCSWPSNACSYTDLVRTNVQVLLQS